MLSIHRNDYIFVDVMGWSKRENKIHDEWVTDNRIKEFGSLENYYRHQSAIEKKMKSKKEM